MTRYALLLGMAAPEQGIQRHLVEFRLFLQSAAGGAWRGDEILTCGPLSWQAAHILRSRMRGYDFVLVYACALAEDEPVPFLQTFAGCTGRVEVRQDVCAEVLTAAEANELEERWEEGQAGTASLFGKHSYSQIYQKAEG